MRYYVNLSTLPWAHKTRNGHLITLRWSQQTGIPAVSLSFKNPSAYKAANMGLAAFTERTPHLMGERLKCPTHGASSHLTDLGPGATVRPNMAAVAPLPAADTPLITHAVTPQ